MWNAQQMPLTEILTMLKRGNLTKRQKSALAENQSQQVFLLFGEPRIGKTTLGLTTSFCQEAVFLDTDKYEEKELLSGVQAELVMFVNDKTKKIMVLAVGKHRKFNREVYEVAESFKAKGSDFLITICEMKVG